MENPVFDPLDLPVPPPEAAKRRYLEQYAGALVTNQWLRLSTALLAACCLLLVMLCAKLYQRAGQVERWVIRVDPSGRAMALPQSEFGYSPHEPEIRYFLIRFFEKHYGRIRSLVQKDFPESLYFLSDRLRRDAVEKTRDGSIEKVLTDSNDEIRVAVRNVAVEDLSAAPYEAVVDFERVRRTRSGLDSGRQRYLAHVSFDFLPTTPNEMIRVNPLGLVILDIRLNEAFAEDPLE